MNIIYMENIEQIKEQQKKRIYLNKDLEDIMKHSIIEGSKLNVLGSYKLQSIKYPNDVDIDIIINKKSETKNFEDIIKAMLYILGKNKKNSLIQIKIDLENGEKEKWENPEENLEGFYDYYKKNFKNIFSMKFDYIIYIDEKLFEYNIVYFFKEKIGDKKKNIESIKKEIEELEKEGNYFKSLKRKFSIYNLNGDEKNISELTKIFNSDLGKDYNDLSTLKTIEILKERKTTPLSPDLEEAINSTFTKLNNKENKNINLNSLENKINEKAKNFVNNFKI